MKRFELCAVLFAAGLSMSGQTPPGCSEVTSSCTFTLSVNLHGPGNGIPGQQESHASGGTLTVSAGGATGTIPWTFIGISGQNTDTDITIMVADASSDVLDFKDSSASLNTLGRTGTATLAFGTGSFHGATGSFSYNFACASNTTEAGICYNGEGIAIPEDFTFTLTGTGTVTIALVPTTGDNLGVSLPIKPGSAANNNTVTLSEIWNGFWYFVTHPGQPLTGPTTGNIVSPRTTGNSGTAEAFSIALPFQPTAATYTASATCANLPTGCWITIPTSSGNIPAVTNSSIQADFNPGSLGSGVYPANVAISVTPSDPTLAPSTVNLPVAYVVTGDAPSLQLSESAIQFQSAAGSSQTQLLHSISLSSTDSISYQATASTLSGGNWLSVSPASGTLSSSENTTALNIVASPTGMAPGSYFSRVDINAPGALPAWQSIEVQLTVAGPGAASPILTPTGLIFVTPQFKTPPSQQLSVSTFSTQPISISAQPEEDDLGSWLKVATSSKTLQLGQPITQTVSMDTAGVTPGVYTGNIYESTGTVEYPVAVVLIITPSSGTCTPTQLVPVLTNVYSGFELLAGQPISLQAQIMDDCGNPLTSGTVQVTTPAGDSPVTLTELVNGQWSGTWLPHAVAGTGASIALSAQSSSGLQGSTSIPGTLDANPAATIVNPGGIVSAANPVAGAPLAPGEFISIYGSNLAPADASSTSFPYSTTLAGTQVLLGGVPLPLQFVSTGFINAVVPFETPINGTQELLIAQNGVYSLPETVVVAAAAPAVFTQDESGQGAGAIIVIPPDANYFETSPSQPASAGDVLVIFCTGLGAVSPAVADGAAAPASSTTVNPVTATIGGQAAQVQFAGLAPGYAGLYQVNVIVPQGVSPGAAVPVVLTIGGFSSSPVTVSLQ